MARQQSLSLHFFLYNTKNLSFVEQELEKANVVINAKLC